MMSLNKKCPICNKQYSNINLSFDVCERHLNWKVTKCMCCKKFVFSDCVGVCPACMPIQEEIENVIHDSNEIHSEFGLR